MQWWIFKFHGATWFVNVFGGVMMSQVGWPRKRWNTSLTGCDCVEKHSWKIIWALILLKMISHFFKMLCREGFVSVMLSDPYSDTWWLRSVSLFHFLCLLFSHFFPLTAHVKCRSLSLYSLTFSSLFFLSLSAHFLPSASSPFPPPSRPPSHPPGWCLQLNLANVTQYWLLLIFIMFVNMFFSSAINLPC